MINSSLPTFTTGAGVAQRTPEQNLPNVSQETNTYTHQAIDIDNPSSHNDAAKSLDSYSVQSSSVYDNSQNSKSTQKLQDFIIANTNANNCSQLPCCGQFNPKRFLEVMCSLSESSCKNHFPKTIIGIGSKEGFIEKCFQIMDGMDVQCYDREPTISFLPVKQAEFPRDIESCLPEDCSSCILFAGYPCGFLGPMLAEFIQRGGTMFCTTVSEGLIGVNRHSNSEVDPNILEKAINDLKDDSGKCFQVQLREYDPNRTSDSYIQFYNWPSTVKQCMFDSLKLKDFCSEIW
ncbi:MAG: hypothetical protein KAG53_01900 [Endozoicomonadaceae bacterium]|nr:hypothetical protein [Endozoicomonadaceae bacterium]